MLCGQTASTATIFSVPGSTMMISSSTMKYMKPRHAGWISTRVVGTATTRMLRGTTVPTLIEKLIWLRSTFGALLDWITVVRILVFCSLVSETAAPVLLPVVAVEVVLLEPWLLELPELG